MRYFYDAAYFKRAQNEHKLTQKELGSKIGKTQQAIAAYENGSVLPDVETLIALSDCFETSVDYLLGLTDIKTRITTIDKSDLLNKEADLISYYRIMNEEQKKSILFFMSELIKYKS